MKKAHIILSCLLGTTVLSSLAMQRDRGEKRLFRQEVANAIRYLMAADIISDNDKKRIYTMLDYAYKTGENEAGKALLNALQLNESKSSRQRLFQ